MVRTGAVAVPAALVLWALALPVPSSATIVYVWAEPPARLVSEKAFVPTVATRVPSR